MEGKPAHQLVSSSTPNSGKAGPLKTYVKHDFLVSQIRRFLEPGPVVLVSSAYDGEQNIMTLGWHMVAGSSNPRLVHWPLGIRITAEI